MKCNTPRLTKKERDAIAVECERQFDDLLEKFNRQAIGLDITENDFCFLGEKSAK